MGISKSRRWKVSIFQRDGWRCRWCGVEVSYNPAASGPFYPTMASLDHLIPQVKGGRNTKDNLVTACRRCNSERGHMSVEDWVNHLENARASRSVPECR